MPGFSLPSASLLAQSILSGIFVGALYGLLGLGLSLSWGLLRLINLAHFGLAFLAAYLCYQLVAGARRSAAEPAADRAAAVRDRRRPALGDGALQGDAVQLAAPHLRPHRHPRGADPGDLDRRLPQARVEPGQRQVEDRRPLLPAARGDHAAAGGGDLVRDLGGAALHRPRQGAARRGRGPGGGGRLRRRPEAQRRCSWPAPARPWPASPASAWRSASPWRRRRSTPGSASCSRR